MDERQTMNVQLWARRLRSFYQFGLVFMLGILLIACQGTGSAANSAYPNGDLLVEPDWVAERTGELSDTRIIDMRAPADYAAAHIPGAVNVPVGAIASTIDGIPLEFDGEAVRDALGSAGLRPEMTAVIYDDLGMMDAARMFWTLEYIGHQDARVMNGGWNAWVAQSLPTTDDLPSITASEYPLTLQPERLATAEDIAARLDDPSVTIIDARSPQEYSGEISYADRNGHIPGAVNLVWLEALTGGDAVHTTQSDWREQLQDEDVERFKSSAEIAALLQEHNIRAEQQIITYCQTMWRGAHVYFLLRLMGFDDVRGYDGSWAEWGNREDLPVEAGT